MTTVFSVRPLPIVLALQALFAMPVAQATNFTVTAGTTDTAGKTLTTGDTGAVAATGSLSSTTDPVIAITGTSGAVTLNNDGTIANTSTGRAIDNNTSGVAITITNNGTITSFLNDALRLNKANSTLTLNNNGSITVTGTATSGGQAIDMRGATGTGAKVINNGSTSNSSALISSSNDDALRPGTNTTINNYGTIISTGTVNTKCPTYAGLPACPGSAPSAQDGIDVGGVTGVVVNNYGTVSGPRHGITADTVVTVTNYASGQIIGRNGSGVGSDGTATVTNYGLISGRYAGAGLAYDHFGNGSTYTDPTQTTVNNGDGDGVDIDGIGTVTNYGRIEGLGGGGYDSGGRPNGGDGLALGGGTVVNAAGAVIWGKSNGILVDDGANGTDTTNLAGNKNRGTSTATASAVTITNSGTITGDRKVGIGLVGDWNDTIVNNSTGVITGGVDTQQVDKLSTDVTQTAGAAIQMGAGNDTLTNYGRIEGKNGLAIDMGSGDDTLKLFAGGSTGVVIGTINGGTGIDTLETGGTQLFSAGTVSNFEKFIVRDGSTTFDYALGTVTEVQVDAGAALKINGAVSTTGNLTVNGTFATAAGNDVRTVAVGGNYVQGAAGVLEAGLGSANQSDKLSVTGTATIADGATIRPVPKTYVANGSSYTLVTATGGLTATASNLSVLNESALVSYSLSQAGNNLMLSAQRKGSIASMASSSASSLGGVLEGLGQGGNAVASSLLGALDSQTSAKAVDDALKQISPDNNHSSQQVSQVATGTVFSALESRIDSSRSGLAQAQTGLAAGDNANRRMWVQGLGAWGKQEQRSDANGYDIYAAGIAGGVEVDRNARDVMGISVGFTRAGTDGTGSGQGDDVSVDSYHVGGYFSQNDADMTLDASVLLGFNSYESQRRVAFPGFSSTLKGDYKGWQLSSRVEVGFPFSIDAAWSGRWLVGGRAAYLATEGYTESGNAAVAQQIGSSSSHSFASVLGAEFTQRLTETTQLQLRTRYLHEFADPSDIKATFVAGGPSFTSSGIKPKRDTLQLGIGYRKVTEAGATVTFGYDAEVRQQYLAHNLTARAVWPF